MWLPSSDITSGNIHLDVCWLDQFTCRYSPLGRLVVWSCNNTSRWTFPLVMSLDGSHMAIDSRLTMANHAHTWWHNMSPLMLLFFKLNPLIQYTWDHKMSETPIGVTTSVVCNGSGPFFISIFSISSSFPVVLWVSVMRPSHARLVQTLPRPWPSSRPGTTWETSSWRRTGTTPCPSTWGWTQTRRGRS